MVDEQTTDGKTGKDCAKKYLTGDLPKSDPEFSKEEKIKKKDEEDDL